MLLPASPRPPLSLLFQPWGRVRSLPLQLLMRPSEDCSVWLENVTTLLATMVGILRSSLDTPNSTDTPKHRSVDASFQTLISMILDNVRIINPGTYI